MGNKYDILQTYIKICKGCKIKVSSSSCYKDVIKLKI